MPDITLLPEIAKIYGVAVEDIITAGESARAFDLGDVTRALNVFMDDRTFEKVLREFRKAKSVRELRIPLEVFMALNASQKDALLDLVLDMDGCETVADDIMQYLNARQRAKLIMHTAINGDYWALETMIPFMSRTIRTEVVMLLLERGQFDFLEEMILFLNHEQKEMIIRYLISNGQEEKLDSLALLAPGRGYYKKYKGSMRDERRETENIEDAGGQQNYCRTGRGTA